VRIDDKSRRKEVLDQFIKGVTLNRRSYLKAFIAASKNTLLMGLEKCIADVLIQAFLLDIGEWSQIDK
jgi:hypothetical protein